MSVASKCVGDILEQTVTTDGAFGDAARITKTGESYECRVDTFGTSTTTAARQPDNLRTHRSYHSSRPPVKVGEVVVWTTTGFGSESPEVFEEPYMLRVMGTGHEGRPGQPPKLYWVEYQEDTSQRLEGL